MAADPTFAAQFGWTICLFGNQAHPGDFHQAPALPRGPGENAQPDDNQQRQRNAAREHATPR